MARRPSLSARKCSSARSNCARSRSWSRGADATQRSFLMVRSASSRVSNHETTHTHPSRRGEDAAPQDEGSTGRLTLQKRNATVAVIGAGDYIGAEIAKKFAAEGFTVFAGRRNGAKLEPLVKEIEV